MLFISWFLHQTTTATRFHSCNRLLFISWFLHQTTTEKTKTISFGSCLSLDSYIKPQLPTRAPDGRKCCLSLDSYIKPQLDIYRNLDISGCLSLDSYIKPQRNQLVSRQARVVYLLIPTSNHNCVVTWLRITWLFISWFLHQTTTARVVLTNNSSCLSLDSYIKPQLVHVHAPPHPVVYLLIPT